MRTVSFLLSAMSLGLAGCALRDGSGNLVFPNLGKPNTPATEAAATSNAPSEAESEAPAPAPMSNEVDPHPDAEEQRSQTVKALDNFLADNYLPGLRISPLPGMPAVASTINHVEYRGHCVIHSDGKDVSLMHLNREFLSNVEWIDPPVGNRFYNITIADDSRGVAVRVKVSSEGAARQVVDIVQALGTTCGS